MTTVVLKATLNGVIEVRCADCDALLDTVMKKGMVGKYQHTCESAARTQYQKIKLLLQREQIEGTEEELMFRSLPRGEDR
jgi:hypothetical protein